MPSNQKFVWTVSEDVDVGILSWFNWEVPGLAREIIYQDTTVVALPKNHGLARQGKISLRDLANEPFVMYERPDKRQIFDEFIAQCHLAGFSPTIVQEASTETVLVGLVAAWLGVTLVPGSLSGLRSDEVVYPPLVDALLTVIHLLISKIQAEVAIERSGTP